MRERERPNLGIISGLARDKPGQHRPNEVKPRVNGALRFDSSFSTRKLAPSQNYAQHRRNDDRVFLYFRCLPDLPLPLHPFLLSSSLVRKPSVVHIFFFLFSFFTYNHAYPNHVYRSIDFFETRNRTQANENFIFRPLRL